MRDIVKDAATITVAKQAMSDEAWMSVETFIATYSNNDKNRAELIATLSLFDLIWQKYEKDTWALEGEYVWYWSIDK